MTNNQIISYITVGIVILGFIVQLFFSWFRPWWKKRGEYKRKCKEYEKKLEKWGEKVVKAIQNTPGGRLKEEKLYAWGLRRKI